MVRRMSQSVQTIDYSITGLDLLRTVGNELKLPLTQISNAANLLASGQFDERERREQYQQLEVMSRRMLQIIDSVLFAGQVETAQVSLQLEPTNVASVVHAVLVDSRYIARRYNKRIDVRITNELVPAAVDPVALRHSIFGLLDVMIRSAESSHIEVLIHHQANDVMITLRDDGPPVSFTQLQAAFKKLGKATRPSRQIPNTTGMAFYVAYSLARAMEGDMLVKNSGEGRAFSLRVPVSQQLELVAL